jgi:hypothetical protein
MMKRRLTALVIGGLLPALSVLAQAGDGDFEVEHPNSLPEEVEAPGREGVSTQELNEEYSTALENVLNQAVPPDASPVPPIPIPDNMSEQVLELPFILLERDFDADADGLSNTDEERLGTDVRHPDTDGDGYIDGLEVVRAYNPLTPSPGDKVSYAAADPATAPVSPVLSITSVRIDRGEEGDVLVLAGTGLPHHLIPLFVFSDPRVVLLRADASGRFLIAVNDLLEEGAHEAYAALTGPAGEIVEASAPYLFTRTAEGIVGPSAQAEEAQPLPQAPATNWVLLAAIGAGAVFVLVVVAVAWLLWRRSRAAAREAEEHSVPAIPPDL